MELSEAMLVFFSVFSLFRVSMANQYDVGGSEGWSTNAKTWSLGKTFEIGDVLTFNYDRNIDSVVQVDEYEFRQCISFRPLVTYRTGRDTVTLDDPGKIYFISGNVQKCITGERMDIIVNADSGSSGYKHYPYSPPGYPTQSSSTNSVISVCLKCTMAGLTLYLLMFLLDFWRV